MNKKPSPFPSVLELARMIDHSLLHPTFTIDVVKAGLELCARYEVAAACVKPCDVGLANQVLTGTGVGVCAVTGFPHGNSTLSIKVAETIQATKEGATEIDMVVNIGRVLGQDWAFVKNEICTVNGAAKTNGAILKVIFENDYLEEGTIIALCRLCTEAEVAFVKTSSGYGFVKQGSGDYNYNGATDAHLKLMRKYSGGNVQIKAAGGVRSLDDLLRVRELGVTRIGATATEAILKDAVARGFPKPWPTGLKG